MSGLNSYSHTIVEVDNEILAFLLAIEEADSKENDDHLPIIFEVLSALPEALKTFAIIREQADDLVCKKIYSSLSVKDLTDFGFTKDGILVRLVTQRYHIVIPETIQAQLLIITHVQTSVGHPGERRMYTSLRRSNYCPRMAFYCHIFVQNCPGCAQERKKQRKYENSLTTFPPKVPLQDLAINLLGPLHRSARGHKQLLVIIYRFTKLTKTVLLCTKQLKFWDVARSFSFHCLFCYRPQ